MTCDIDKIYNVDRLDKKRFFLEGNKRSFKWKEKIPPETKNLVIVWQILIDPDGSHPKDKSG